MVMCPECAPADLALTRQFEAVTYRRNLRIPTDQARQADVLGLMSHVPLDRRAEPGGRRPLDLRHLDPVGHLENDRPSRGITLRHLDLPVAEVGVASDVTEIGIVGLPVAADDRGVIVGILILGTAAERFDREDHTDEPLAAVRDVELVRTLGRIDHLYQGHPVGVAVFVLKVEVGADLGRSGLSRCGRAGSCGFGGRAA